MAIRLKKSKYYLRNTSFVTAEFMEQLKTDHQDMKANKTIYYNYNGDAKWRKL